MERKRKNTEQGGILRKWTLLRAMNLTGLVQTFENWLNFPYAFAIGADDQAVAFKGWPRNGNNPSSAKFFLCRGSLIILSEASAEESCKIVPRHFLQ